MSKGEIAEFERDFAYLAKDEYKPPEINNLQNGESISTKLDVWQLGALLNELISWSSISYTKSLINLKEIMMKKNPSERPQIKDILQHIANIENLPQIKEKNLLSGNIIGNSGQYKSQKNPNKTSTK